MGNKINSVSNSRIIDNKLAVILEEVNNQLKEAPTEERELLLINFNNIVQKFYSTLTNPILNGEPFRSGVIPDYKKINNKFFEAGQDLDILFREVNSLHGFVVQNFNTLNTLSAALRARIRKISSDLADYKLYANDNLGGALYFSDTFKNTDKIDYADRLYREDKCFVDIFSGHSTLPLDESKTEEHIIEGLTIGSSSNGVSGNNQEIGALKRDRLGSISDSNPDTWFEYEAVSQEATNTPLIIELKIRLDSDAIVNTIDISTTAFTTKRQAKITKLEVSSDGVTFTSILEEIATSVEAPGSTKKIINLNASSENISETNRFYFDPRKIRFINMVIQQDDSYIIRTAAGKAFRKAIGIRSISVLGQAFKRKGELITTTFSANGSEISKIALTANVKQSIGLTTFNHYISNNDGQNWYQIEPVESVRGDSPEILNFNLDLEGAVSTDVPVTSFRYKTLMDRSPVGFSARGGTVLIESDKREFLNISPGTQSITLSEKPVRNTVSLFNVSYGSVGGDNFFFIPSSKILTRDTKAFVYLPREPFFKQSISFNQEIVRINNELWARTNDLTAHGAEKVYEFDYLNNIIKFGDGTNGLKPVTDIEFGLKREKVLVSNDRPRVLQTTFSTDEVTETTSVYRLDKQTTKASLILRKQGSVHGLGVTDVVSISVVNDTSNVLQTEKNYINGSDELTAAGDYSIDYLNGDLYTRSLTPDNSDVVIDIAYRPRISVSGFTFSNGQIEIPNDFYITEKKNINLNIASSTNVIDLGEECVEPRSLRFLTLNSNFIVEVPFIGDGSEFDLPLTPAQLNGYYTVDYKAGKIFTYNSVSGTLIAEFNKSEYYAEYNIAVEIPREDYITDFDNSIVSLSERYIIKTFSTALGGAIARNLFKASYRYAEELDQNPRELEPFFTPLLMDYKISVLTRDRL